MTVLDQSTQTGQLSSGAKFVVHVIRPQMYVFVPFWYNPLCIRPMRLAKGSFEPRGVLSAQGV